MLNDSTCLCDEGIGLVDAAGAVICVNLSVWLGGIAGRQTIDLICIEDCDREPERKPRRATASL
jgi:hypothetical protein